MQVGVKELVPAVRQLVEFECSSLAAADTIAAAEGIVAADPDLLLHRIVAHFQHLFDCPSLEGILPALNQVLTARCPQTSLTQSRNHALTHSLTHPFTHLSIHKFIHTSSIQPCNYPFICSYIS